MPPDWMPLITMITKNLGDKVEIRFRDNGTGMPADVREKIFNPVRDGARKNCNERESMKRDRRSGASRKSSALRVGGVSSTSRS